MKGYGPYITDSQRLEYWRLEFIRVTLEPWLGPVVSWLARRLERVNLQS